MGKTKEISRKVGEPRGKGNGQVILPSCRKEKNIAPLLVHMEVGRAWSQQREREKQIGAWGHARGVKRKEISRLVQGRASRGQERKTVQMPFAWAEVARATAGRGLANVGHGVGKEASRRRAGHVETKGSRPGGRPTREK